MKKLSLIVAGLFLVISSTFASNYKMDEAAIDNMFVSAEELTMSSDALLAAPIKLNEEKTKTGFLLRAWFCGVFALHRSYMGTGGKSLLLYYLCIPVANCVVINVDFWGVIIKGDERLNMYKDNPNWMAWKKK